MRLLKKWTGLLRYEAEPERNKRSAVVAALSPGLIRRGGRKDSAQGDVWLLCLRRLW